MRMEETFEIKRRGDKRKDRNAAIVGSFMINCFPRFITTDKSVHKLNVINWSVENNQR